MNRWVELPGDRKLFLGPAGTGLVGPRSQLGIGGVQDLMGSFTQNHPQLTGGGTQGREATPLGSHN